MILTISILLNLVFAGVGAGLAIQCANGPSWKPKAEMARLSPEAKSLMGESFAKNRRAMDKVFKDAKKARHDVVNILTAETFDKDAYQKASNTLREQQVQIMTKRADAAGELAVKMKPEDRKIMAEWLAGPIRGMGKGKAGPPMPEKPEK
jgi:uncharacterized membrane protein